MHLVGYLYEDYYDARSHEHKVTIKDKLFAIITNGHKNKNLCMISVFRLEVNENYSLLGY
jgi:hypothetical protein